MSLNTIDMLVFVCSASYVANVKKHRSRFVNSIVTILTGEKWQNLGTVSPILAREHSIQFSSQI